MNSEKKVTSRGRGHKVTKYLNHRLYDQKIKNCPDTLLVNFDLYSKFRITLISIENVGVPFKVTSAVGAIIQLKCAKIHGVTCQKIVLFEFGAVFQKPILSKFPLPLILNKISVKVNNKNTKLRILKFLPLPPKKLETNSKF
jgi:hypothetical protein